MQRSPCASTGIQVKVDCSPLMVSTPERSSPSSAKALVIKRPLSSSPMSPSQPALAPRRATCVRFLLLLEEHRGRRLSRLGKKSHWVDLSRRKFLAQYCQTASLAFLPAGLGLPSFNPFRVAAALPGSSDYHLHPQYRAQRELDTVLRKVQSGFDAFI